MKTPTQSRQVTAVVINLIGWIMASAIPASAQTRPSIAGLQAQIATLQTQVIPNMAGYVTMDLSTQRPTLRVAGANLQVVNGLGTTQTANGLGNVIVGYDEARGFPPEVCSLGVYTTFQDCEAGGGGTWAISHKSGSHNVVVGRLQNYSRYGGIVAGEANTINGEYSSVSGGYRNIASGTGASVGGGQENSASGGASSVSGGLFNTASGGASSVSAGYANSAQGSRSSVSGGQNNFANNLFSSVSGGFGNIAAAGYDSISGGNQNRTSGVYSSVSGGAGRTAVGTYDWIAGALFQDE